MRVPVSWLRDYVAFDKPLPELAELMSMTGTKVEALHRRGVPDGLDLYRVGRVLTREQHPNADRLSLCTVDIGAERAPDDRLRRRQLPGGRDRRRGAARAPSCPTAPSSAWRSSAASSRTG